jgi:putative drug exporter of the RND superfamily
MLERLASFCFRKRRYVVAVWILALPAMFALSSAIGGEFSQKQGGDLKGVDSERAYELIAKAFPESVGQAAGESGEIVFEVPAAQGGIAAKKAEITAFLTKVANTTVSSKNKTKIAKRVSSPFDPQALVTQDGTVGISTVDFSDGIDRLVDPKKLIVPAKELRKAGVTTEFGGQSFYGFEFPPSEIFGLIAAVIILVLAFGSLIAMGLPILTALLGVGIAIALVQISARVFQMPSFVTQLSGMIGLGVGIDYVLFIITRYREELRTKNSHDATVRALATSGRAVVFAGITVMISMLGMFLMRLSFVNGIAIAGAMPVAVIVLASVTLIPAMLGFIGPHINSKRQRARLADTTHEHRETIWHRWSRLVQRRAWLFAIGGFSVLILLSIPFFSLRLGFTDLGNGKAELTTTKAYNIKARAFGPGANGPFLIAAEVKTDQQKAALPKLIEALQKNKGVAAVLPPNPLALEKGVAVLTMFPTTGPQEEATTDLVHNLRDVVVPAAIQGTNLRPYVGGFTASGVDFSDVVARRLLVFIGAVLVLSFLLLMAVFRSILVPLKAVIMNLLSIGASYGVITWIFQLGHGAKLIGLGKAGPIEPWAPMMLFAIVFGLSMDYEVFLLSKIREEFDRRQNNSVAVVEGLASTARLITAAAAIMVCVFLGFVAGDRTLKLFGIGLATAVFLDATIVRILLVPATMELLGDKNWWFPGWLDRLIPKLNVEGTAEHIPHGVPIGTAQPSAGA